MTALLGKSIAQKWLTILSVVLVVYSWLSHRGTGDPTPLILVAAIFAGSVLDIGLTVKSTFRKEIRQRITGAATHTTCCVVVVIEVVIRQLVA